MKLKVALLRNHYMRIPIVQVFKGKSSRVSAMTVFKLRNIACRRETGVHWSPGPSFISLSAIDFLLHLASANDLDLWREDTGESLFDDVVPRLRISPLLFFLESGHFAFRLSSYSYRWLGPLRREGLGGLSKSSRAKAAEVTTCIYTPNKGLLAVLF